MIFTVVDVCGLSAFGFALNRREPELLPDHHKAKYARADFFHQQNRCS